MLLEKVFPAIREKWHGRKSRTIKVQQDNARPHVQDINAALVKAGQEYGWDIQMSLQHQTPTIDTDGLIAAVETAFGSCD
ncbi:hypothetical protein PC116_g12843 [Phytophthora cactorum]|nr:hypothetical protein PC116_g12843 [Phytophthora cactorum]